jgi:RimJ/RimL family protein N-acetyltransferase
VTALWRRATPADAVALRDLEKAASSAGLGHVFGDLPYPDDDVLARWAIVLLDPEVTTEVVEDADGLVAFAAHDGTWLRHLGVRPDAWGTGLGREAVARSLTAGSSRLWVLEANHRARGLYDSLGWRPTGTTRECPWPPYPTEMEYVAPAVRAA